MQSKLGTPSWPLFLPVRISHAWAACHDELQSAVCAWSRELVGAEPSVLVLASFTALVIAPHVPTFSS
jgi:hypothetical protein